MSNKVALNFVFENHEDRIWRKTGRTFYLAESPTLDFHCEQKNSFYSVYNAVAYYTLQYCSKKIFSAFFSFFFLFIIQPFRLKMLLT